MDERAVRRGRQSRTREAGKVRTTREPAAQANGAGRTDFGYWETAPVSA